MASLDIGQSVIGKEAFDRRDSIITDIPTPRPADKKRRTIEPGNPRIRIGEVSHAVERLAQHGQGNAEFQRLVVGADQVGQEELADGEGLAVALLL